MHDTVAPLCCRDDVVPPDAWCHPGCGWELDVVVGLLAHLAPRDIDAARGTSLARGILPATGLRDLTSMTIDAQGALRCPLGFTAATDLLAWVLECLWGDSDAREHLVTGHTLVRTRDEGSHTRGFLCVPLRPSESEQTIVACSIDAADHDEVIRCASRLTVVTHLLAGSCRVSEGDVIRAASESTESPDTLTPRQEEILRGMARGLTNRQIALRIAFSESTVRLESIAIYRRLGVHSRSQAVMAARQVGLLRELSLSEGA